MSSAAKQVFASRRDLWLTGVLAGAALFEIGAAVMVLFGPGRPPGAGDLGVAALLIAGAGFILWTLLDTRYVVDGVTLTIRCGPFRWKVPIANIRRLTTVTGVASAPALSVHRVALDIQGRGGSLEISPADPSAFAQAVGVPLDAPGTGPDDL